MVEDLASRDFDYYLKLIKTNIIEFAPKIILSGLLLWIGFKLIKKVNRLLENSLKRMQVSDTMRPFLLSLLSTILKIALLFTAISILGVELSGLVTIIAAMGFAIGLSLQGSLGNFASGILILFIKPYKVGDWIQIEEKFGKVEEIGIFNTVLITPGNKTLIVPNSKITDDVVTNFSKKGVVRLELSVHIPYSVDFPEVKIIILEALGQLSVLIEKPSPEIGIENFDSHSIQLAVRPYTTPDHYWEATFQSYQAIKSAFHKNGIQVAYSEGIELGDIGK
ncbi:mechanosensitive ion channel [Flavobacteriaceae bacterium MHTCC 0001]